MKKIIIGLAAVAAMGVSALCCSNSKERVMLSENVSALSEAYCAYQPGEWCRIEWLDGDFWESEGFVKVGMDEMDEFLHDIYLKHKEIQN